MIQVQSLIFGYPHNPFIFDEFSLKIERGETWAILGASGCGKTTLLYLLAGLYPPNGGQILFDDRPLTRPRPRTGLILQDYGLLPWATVRQNAELGLRVRKFYGPDGTHAPRDFQPHLAVGTWLERLGISTIADKYPSQISGGQRQRTAIARMLAIQPDLLLMDEPFSSLDAVIREDLQSLTLELCTENHLTLVMVTHTIEEAVMMGRKILLLEPPPNCRTRIFDNPKASQCDYRNSAAFQFLCKTLREEMSPHEAA